MKPVDQGFTLAELVVSLAIFLIVVMGIAFAISSILSTHSLDYERTQALFLGREKAIELAREGVPEELRDNAQQRLVLSESPRLEYSVETLYSHTPPYPTREEEYIRDILVVHYSEGSMKFDF